MTETLVIRLRSIDDAPASWLIIDGNGARSGSLQNGPIADALGLAQGRRTVLVLPATEVTLAGTVRTLGAETRELALRRLEEIATGVARGFGCEALLDHKEGYPVTHNDPGAVSRFNKVALETLGSERLRAVENPVMGGEDFSFYSHEVPSCFFVLGLIPPGSRAMPQLHQPTFDFNDGAIATGVEDDIFSPGTVCVLMAWSPASLQDAEVTHGRRCLTRVSSWGSTVGSISIPCCLSWPEARARAIGIAG